MFEIAVWCDDPIIKKQLIEWIEQVDSLHLTRVCKACKENDVLIDDPFDVIKILMGAYKEQYIYQEFMERNFAEIAKEHGIKFPVITYERQRD